MGHGRLALIPGLTISLPAAGYNSKKGRLIYQPALALAPAHALSKNVNLTHVTKSVPCVCILCWFHLVTPKTRLDVL